MVACVQTSPISFVARGTNALALARASGAPNYTFYGGNVICVPFTFIFFTAAHFHLAGR